MGNREQEASEETRRSGSAVLKKIGSPIDKNGQEHSFLLWNIPVQTILDNPTWVFRLTGKSRTSRSLLQNGDTLNSFYW